MGVKELWPLIDQVKVHKTFCEITNETVAVDLSMWIIDSQSVKQMQGTVVKPHLRNLFFRTSALFQAGVLPIFVTEGKPPELKWKTMMDRQNVRQGRKTNSSVVTKKKSNRSHFNQVIKECCEMLEVMGVPYIQSDGEAEATCAALNAAGVVDAVITEDGDTFLYGAKRVYKNFTTSKDQSVDSYSMVDIEATIGLTRDDMIALALLLGCDYCPKGVPGIGKVIALKFFEELSGENMLIRMKQWNAGISSDASRTEQLIAAKATKVDRFPDQRIIDEYNNTSCEISKAERSWNRPNIAKFQEFCLKKLDWVYSYALEKILPLSTLWDMKYILNHPYPYTNSLQPERIVKNRVRQGVKSLEIIWWIKDNCLLEDDNHFLTDQNRTTTEEYSLIKKCFPDAVEQFEENKAAQQNGKKKRVQVRKIAAVEEVDIETDDIYSSDGVEELDNHFASLNIQAFSSKVTSSINLPANCSNNDVERFMTDVATRSLTISSDKSLELTNYSYILRGKLEADDSSLNYLSSGHNSEIAKLDNSNCTKKLTELHQSFCNGPSAASCLELSTVSPTSRVLLDDSSQLSDLVDKFLQDSTDNLYLTDNSCVCREELTGFISQIDVETEATFITSLALCDRSETPDLCLSESIVNGFITPFSTPQHCTTHGKLTSNRAAFSAINTMLNADCSNSLFDVKTELFSSSDISLLDVHAKQTKTGASVADEFLTSNISYGQFNLHTSHLNFSD